MKLKLIEGHWRPLPQDYPNSLIKAKKERVSFLLYPKDKDKFLKWGQRKKKKRT